MRKRSKNLDARIQKIEDVVSKNGLMTIKEISLETGIPVPTVGRILKNHNIDKCDMRDSKSIREWKSK